MKIAILTTQTPHHAFFVREVAKRFQDVHVVCESRGLRPPFETSHPFEAARDAFERDVWFHGGNPVLGDFVPSITVETINSAEGVRALANLRADVAIVFGTGRLSSTVLNNSPDCCLNLHGGDPEQYRGLDSHLWAIYHSDFDGLVTTLHKVNATLDDGDICLQEDVPIIAGMRLHELRRANTVTCVRLAIAALSSLESLGTVPCRRQRHAGRYYSFMPSELKETCRKRFEAHSDGLAISATADGARR